MNEPTVCHAFRLALSAQFDGEDPGAAGADAHVAAGHEEVCAACRAFRHDLERLRRPLREDRAHPLPAALSGRILKGTPLAPPEGRGRGWPALSLARPLFGMGALALVLMVLLVVVFGTRRTSRAPSPEIAQLRQATLHEGVLTVKAGGEAVLRTPAGRSLRLWGGPGRLAVLSFTDEGVELRQEAGRLCSRWTVRSPIPFRLHVGSSHLEITGTAWRLAIDPTEGGATLDVAEGEVLLVTPVARLAVPALRRVKIAPSGELSPPLPFNPFVDPEFEMPATQIQIGNH